MIVGGGIVGLATALNILESKPELNVAVLEKEDGGIVVLRDADEVEKIKNVGGLVKGSWPLPAPGKIVITLDNSYSMMRSKQVKCSVSFQVDEQVVVSGSSC